LYEVEEREPGRLVTLRYRDHKTQVRLDERATRRVSVACRTGQLATGCTARRVAAELLARLSAGFHALRQRHLVAFGQKRMRAMSTRYRWTRSSCSCVAWRDLTMATYRRCEGRGRRTLRGRTDKLRAL
jgi:hypothetical protein